MICGSHSRQVRAITRGALPLRYLKAFFAVWKAAREADVVYVNEHLALLHVLAGKRKRVLLVVATAVVVAGGGAYAWQRLAPRSTPTGQPQLVHLSPENLAAFARAFDAADDGRRVLALLSPT